MKNLFTVLIMTVALLIASAGMGKNRGLTYSYNKATPELLSEYYVTDKEGFTERVDREDDIQYVKDIEQAAPEVAWDVEYVWINHFNSYIIVKATIIGYETRCVGLLVDSLAKTLTPDYRAGEVLDFRYLNCGTLDASLDMQLNLEHE